MREKTIDCFLIIFFILTACIYAQEWPSADEIVATIQTKMDLNQQQLIQVKLIIKENMAERQHIQPQLVQGLTQAQAEPLDTELYLKLSEVLTRAQMNQWNRIHEHINERMDMNH